MIGGGIQEIPAVSKLKKLGYLTIVTDINKNAPAFQYADLNLVFDARDCQGIISWVLSNKNKFNISGIFTLTSQAPSVAIIANATSLPSLSVETALNCDNKLLMKRKFQLNNLPTADYFEVHNYKEVQNYLIKYPSKSFYLKAVDGFGGKGVRKLNKDDDIFSIFSSISDFSSFPILLLEEALKGEFIDVQGIFYEDKFFPAGSADSYFSNEIEEYSNFNPVEIFNVSPSQQSKNNIDAAYALLELSCRKLGMKWGPVGGDLILTDDGLKIIEIGPRLHGPNGTLRIFPESTGIKPFEFMAQCVTNDRPNIDFLKNKYQKVALCQVFVSAKKNIKEVGFKSNPKNLPGLFDFNFYHGRQTNIKDSESTLSGLASAFVIGESYDDAMKNLKIIKKDFYIK